MAKSKRNGGAEKGSSSGCCMKNLGCAVRGSPAPRPQGHGSVVRGAPSARPSPGGTVTLPYALGTGRCGDSPPVNLRPPSAL